MSALWARAAYLVSTATLGIGWYETEWVMIRKLRRVMVNLEAFPADRGGVPLAEAGGKQHAELLRRVTAVRSLPQLGDTG